MARVEIRRDGMLVAAQDAEWSPVETSIYTDGEERRAVYLPKISLGPIVKFHFAQGTPLHSLLSSCTLIVDQQPLGVFSLIHGRREKDLGEVVARSLVFVEGELAQELRENAYLEIMAKI